jgi:hypothetical protein
MYRLNTILLAISILTSCSEKEKKSFCLENCECEEIVGTPLGIWGNELNAKYTYQRSVRFRYGFEPSDTLSLTSACIDSLNEIRKFKRAGRFGSNFVSYHASDTVAYSDTTITIPLGKFKCKLVVNEFRGKTYVDHHAYIYIDSIFYSIGHGIIRSSHYVESCTDCLPEIRTLIGVEQN